MNNQFGLNTGINVGISGNGLTGPTVSDTINNINKYKEEIDRKYEEEKTQQLVNSANTMYECSVKSSDGTTRNINISGANAAYMELIIKQAAKKAGSKAYDNLGEGEVLCRFLNKNPDAINSTNKVLKNQIGVGLWAAENGLEIPESEPIEKKAYDITPEKGKKWPEYIGWGLGVNEAQGWLQQGIGRLLLNSTKERLPSDISRSKRFYKYEELPSRYNAMLDEINKQIAELEPQLNTQHGSQASEELNRLYGQKQAIEERLNEIGEIKQNLPSTELDTTKQTAKNGPRIWGGDEKASRIYSVESDIYFTKEIQPYINASNAEFNIPEMIKSLKREDFMVSEGTWKKIQEKLREEAKAYKNMTNASLSQLENEAQAFKLSNKALGGETSDSITKLVNDKLHTIFRNKVVQTLEQENPGVGITNMFNTYSNYRNLEDRAEELAVAAGKRSRKPLTPSGARNAVREGTTKAGFRNWLGNYDDIVGKWRRPSTWLYETGKGLWNAFSKSGLGKYLKSAFASMGKRLHVGDPIGTIQLLELGGDLWDSMLGGDTYVGAATDALGEIPGVQVADMLMEISSLSREWERLSEEGKVNALRSIWDEQYGINMSYEDALRNYRELIQLPKGETFKPTISA